MTVLETRPDEAPVRSLSGRNLPHGADVGSIVQRHSSCVVNFLRTFSVWLPVTVICSCGPQAPQDAAEESLNAARRFAEEGKFEQALERQVWFHNHALDVRPSYYGVRLSYALADWIKLGEKYPKALEELKNIRDEKTSRLLGKAEDRTLFHDVASINEHLKEPVATVDLFRTLDRTQPEFAASVYEMVEKALIAVEEFGLAKQYLVDPTSRLNAARQTFELGLGYAKSRGSDDKMRKTFESLFAAEIVRIITVLDKTGDSDVAREIQSKALSVLDNPDIRNAIQ